MKDMNSLQCVEDIKTIPFIKGKGIHNHSIHIRLCYDYLEKFVKERKVFLFKDEILFIFTMKNKNKAYILKEQVSEQGINMLKDFNSEGIIYSPFKLSDFTCSPFVEAFYDLCVLHSPASYPNSKKRYQRLVYPLKQITKEQIGVTHTFDDVAEIERVHAEWVEKKLNDEKTFRMMFPSKRYIHCVEVARRFPDLFRCYFFTKNEKLIAIRIIGADGSTGYDMANFGLYWHLSSNIMESLNFYVLHDLYVNKFLYFNCGAVLNSTLKCFKNHYPSKSVTSYMISREKKEEKEEAKSNAFF